MREFAAWLAGTDFSQTIASSLWMIPVIQSVHILTFGVLIGALLMVDLRILGFIAKDQSLVTVTRRFAPWIWGCIVVLATTGLLLIVGEPARELLSVSFWVKMSLLAVGLIIAAAFQIHVRNNEVKWAETETVEPVTKFFAVISFFIWLGIIAMCRLIAWDAEIWGSLSSQA
jgi:putative copper export protein